jgi:large subunit ribosomal protein L4
MPKVDILNMSGTKVGEYDLNDQVFAVPINEYVVADCIIAEQANKRQGTHSTKTVATIRGGGAKPWRQKGTGRARVGTNRNPLWKGGAVAHGPHPRDYNIKVPKRVKKLAYCVVFSDKVNEGRLVVIDDIKFNEIKTKNMVEFLNNISAKTETGDNNTRKLIITGEKDQNTYFSGRNIEKVEIIPANNISVFELVKADTIIISKDAVAKVEEVLLK